MRARAARRALGLSAPALLVATSVSAASPPPTPSFGPSIDPFASYDPQDTCDATAKPGTVGFRDFILDTYPSTGNSGIVRNCSVGGTSEHKEGRAWDWTVNVNNAAQKDIAETVIDWLLNTDQHGNACAIARRVGTMYLIWNKQIWGAYRSPNGSCATAGWKSYTGSNPHTDHVHISFSWAGAKKQTSWWSAAGPIDPGHATLHDVNGDGRADLVSVNADGSAYVWSGQTSGKLGSAVASFDGTLDSANLDGTGHFIVGVVDVTGDRRADLVSVSGDGSAYVWPGQTSGAFGAAVASFDGTLDAANVDGTGHYIVGVADVTGDGRADLVSASDAGSAWVWPGQTNGSFGAAVESFDGTLDSANVDGAGHLIVAVADVSGDGRADLVSVRDDGSAYVWPGQASGVFGGAAASFDGTLNVANLDGSGHYIVGVADVTGDGRADLVSASDDGSAYVWPGTSNATFGSAVSSFDGTLNAANVDGSGHYITGLADITGDGRADLVSASDDGSAYVWPGQSSGSFGAAVSSFDGTLNAANVDATGHYIVAPSGPSWLEPADPNPSAGGTGAGGAAGSGAGPGWSGASGAETDPGASPNGDGPGTEADAEGCACRAAGGSPHAPAWLAVIALGLLRARRRRWR